MKPNKHKMLEAELGRTTEQRPTGFHYYSENVHHCRWQGSPWAQMSLDPLFSKLLLINYIWQGLASIPDNYCHIHIMQ